MHSEITDTNVDDRASTLDGLGFRLVIRGPTARLVCSAAPLCALIIIALALRHTVPNWIFMWMMATALFFGCKWLTFFRASHVRSGARPRHTIGYFIAWPGMDAPRFFGSSCGEASKEPFTRRMLLLAAARLCLGLILLWLAVQNPLHLAPLLKGWLGMIGLVLSLHFGLFGILAWCWRRAGVDVEPVMRAPLSSCSLGEFWGARWNTAFHRLAYTLIFRPLAGLGSAGATLLVFVVSGLVHESVISLPARAGYGLPTAYFVLQGCAVVIERSRIGRRLGLGRGISGRLFALAAAGLPAYWLFHPAFVFNVVLPMLAAFSGIKNI